MKPEDKQAARIQWGVELETRLPLSSNVAVGGYHSGLPVRVGLDATNGLPLNAPVFGRDHWKG